MKEVRPPLPSHAKSQSRKVAKSQRCFFKETVSVLGELGGLSAAGVTSNGLSPQPQAAPVLLMQVCLRAFLSILGRLIIRSEITIQGLTPNPPTPQPRETNPRCRVQILIDLNSYVF